MIAGRCLRSRARSDRRHHDRDRAVGLLAAVQQPQRLGDPPRILVVLNRYRLLVEVRLRVLGGVLAVGHRDRTEVPAGRTGQVHVALGDHGDLRRRRRKPVRIREGIVRRRRIGLSASVSHEPRLHLTESHAGPLVERPVCHHDIGHPGRDGHRRLLDGRARGARRRSGSWRRTSVRPMPAARATATSVLVSIVNVVSPSTSDGLRPASSNASNTASAASRSSLRPESFEKSVAPMPTMAARPDNITHSPSSAWPSR